MRKSHTSALLITAVMSVVMCGCKDRNKPAEMLITTNESAEQADSAIYGVCGRATTMHMLQLVTDLGDTIDFALMDNDDNAVDVKGGLLAGDRMAVLRDETQKSNVARKVINMTTLLGRWNSIDKDFVIEEGGVVRSNVKAEDNTWVSWKLLNGKLLLNKDTFEINTLGADSLYLENSKGIFVYTRAARDTIKK